MNCLKLLQIIFMTALLLQLLKIFLFIATYSSDHNNVIIDDNAQLDSIIPVTSADVKRESEKEIPVIAYVISVTGCGNNGILDGAAVLKRSIQDNSYPKNPNSRYGYKLYAFGHSGHVFWKHNCKTRLLDLGYEVMMVDLPVQRPLYHLERHYPRLPNRKPDTMIELDGCCGSKELIKLHVYNMTAHDVVVHLDADVLFVKPLDLLYDAMIYSKDSPEGKNARYALKGHIDVTTVGKPLPDTISAYIVKDWCGTGCDNNGVIGVQAGIIIVRPNETVLNEYVDIIKEGNYIPGYGAGKGWGGKGYGFNIHGSMTIQGIMAYYYDIINPTAVQLHHCKYNAIGCNSRCIRGRHAFSGWTHKDPIKANETVAGCKDGRDNCDDVDCQTWSMEETYVIHYCNCHKPWDCPNTTLWEPYVADTICREHHKKWFEVRAAIDDKWHEKAIYSYEKDLYNGYCKDSGFKNYVSLYF